MKDTVSRDCPVNRGDRSPQNTSKLLGLSAWHVAIQIAAVTYVLVLTLFLVHPDAFSLFGAGGETVEDGLDVTVPGLLQHCAAYFVMGVLVHLGFARSAGSRWPIVGSLLGHAIATELIQKFVPNRTCDGADVLANVIGVVSAFAICQSNASGRLRRLSATIVCLSTLVVCACSEVNDGRHSVGTTPTPRPAEFIRSVDWVGAGQWLKVDTHCHTRFSDGAHTVAEVLAKAAEFGCDAVAVTDHIDRLDAEDIPRYLEAIDVARRQFPELMVIVGLEWNIPPGGGDDHATVLFPDSLATVETLTEFCEQFDDYGREIHDVALAKKALRWLEDLADKKQPSPLVSLNHPSRKFFRCEEITQYYETLAPASSVLIGFSGAPGHQAGQVIGAYNGPLETVDRWDPVVSTDSAWDALLRRGHRVWGALAPSDFHRPGGESWGDYWPGEFSETWVYASERASDAVLQSLERGMFFASHCGIARDVQLTVMTDGLERPAHVGEVVSIRPGETIVIGLTLRAPLVDLFGRPNRIDEAELLLVTTDGVTTRKLPCDDEEAISVKYETTVKSEVIAVRSRGRRRVDDGPDLMFYTNPIWINSGMHVTGDVGPASGMPQFADR